MADPRLRQWQQDGRLVTFCPECASGMPVPRPSAEICPGSSAADVLSGTGQVRDIHGTDITASFIAAARTALARATKTGCQAALLADGSPSCGSTLVYDGTFSGTKHPGLGITAALLHQNGLRLFSNTAKDLDDLAIWMDGETPTP